VPDELRSPIKHHLVLQRIDPEQGIRCCYSLMIARDLFGIIRLVRNWGQKLVEEFASEDKAGKALEVRWLGLSEQRLRLAKWSVCQG
jgi:hypothetical protein